MKRGPQPQSAAPFSGEELRALRTLARSRRLMVNIVPEKASDEFCQRLTTWLNLCLDTKLMPPVLVPATRVGDGLACPYCNAPIRAAFKADPEHHREDCEWRQAILRWAYANAKLDGDV